MMKEHEKLLLADAIETAIEAEKDKIMLRRFYLVSAFLNILLSIILLFR